MGHGWPGDGEGRRQLGELGGGAFGARRKGKEAELSSAVERLWRGCLYIGLGGGGEEGRQAVKRRPVVLHQCASYERGGDHLMRGK
jgi:hypothetical protein